MNTKISKSIIAAAVAAAFTLGLALSVGASEQIKGAQKLMELQKASQASTVAPAAAAPAAPAMSCSKCTTVSEKVVDVQKGHIQTTSIVDKHACPSCSTKIVVKGVGKAKTDVAVHSCTMGGETASCCAGM